MIDEILATLHEHFNQNQRKQALKHGCDIDVIGVSIADLKKIAKQYNIKNNDQLINDLLNSSIYELLYLGYICFDSKQMDLQLFEKLYNKTNYNALNEYQLSLIAAECSQANLIMQYLTDLDTDKSYSCYYALLKGAIMLDPDYDEQFIINQLQYIKNTILNQKIRTKFQMSGFLALIATQKPHLENQVIEIYNSYKDVIDFQYKETKCTLTDIQKHIDSCKKRSKIKTHYKTCRC